MMFQFEMTESLRELVRNYLLVPIAGNKWEMPYTMLIVERITHHWTCYFYPLLLPVTYFILPTPVLPVKCSPHKDLWMRIYRVYPTPGGLQLMKL